MHRLRLANKGAIVLANVFLNQPVVVFEDRKNIKEGGLLGIHGVVVGINHHHRTCTVELSNGEYRRNVAFEAVEDVLGSQGIIDDDGKKATGVYRSRAGRIVIFSFQKYDRDVINYELRLPTEGGLFPRLDVWVPYSVDMTEAFVRATLSATFSEQSS